MPAQPRKEEMLVKEYGDLMSFLLYFRESEQSEEEFRQFALKEIRSFVYDLRDFGIEISLSHHNAARERDAPMRRT